jgi:hypothetical protein
MYPHHQQAIEKLKRRFQDDPGLLALMIIGSVARGDAHERSDIDAYLIVTDEEYLRRHATGTPSFTADDLCDYPDGHAGGSLVDLQFLHDVVARGTEPARFAFVNAIIAFSHVPHLEQIVARIPQYPRHVSNFRKNVLTLFRET